MLYAIDFDRHATRRNVLHAMLLKYKTTSTLTAILRAMLHRVSAPWAWEICLSIRVLEDIVIYKSRFPIWLMARTLWTHSTRAHLYFMKEIKTCLLCEVIKHFGIVRTLRYTGLDSPNTFHVLSIPTCFITPHSTHAHSPLSSVYHTRKWVIRWR